jgi:hypothetical protein
LDLITVYIKNPAPTVGRFTGEKEALFEWVKLKAPRGYMMQKSNHFLTRCRERGNADRFAPGAGFAFEERLALNHIRFMGFA